MTNEQIREAAFAYYDELGQVVYFQNDDGEYNRFALNTKDRAERFKVRVINTGGLIISKADFLAATA